MKKKYLFLFALLMFLFTNKVIAAEFINRIDINYDTTKVRISPAYTYNEVRAKIHNNWSVPEDANYSVGNNNIWMYYCPTNERCTDDYTGGYEPKVKSDRYTWVNFEIYAKPFGLDKENPDYDFDEDNLDAIEVYVNGVKRDDVLVQGYNDSWREVDVLVPVLVDTSSFVSGIKVNSNYSNVAKGSTASFTKEIEFYGEDYDAVIWTVSGNTSLDTTINSEGILNVDSSEEAESLTVRATSAQDNTVYGEKVINVLDELVVESVKVRPTELTAVKGGSVWFYETVTGSAPHTVNWSVSGNNSESTTITSEGNLKVALDETASTLTVTATSTYDDTKSASATVTVNTDRTFINKIEINYNTKEAYLTTKTIYNDVRNKFKNNWSVGGDNYAIGNNNIYFNYCPTKARCSLAETKGGYTEDVLDVYTYADFEIYAAPFGLNSENPIYDFDENNLDKIEVWVNGIKRDDVIIYYYNDSWRSVDVFVPVPVKVEKLPQSLRFLHDEYTTYYENDDFKNNIYHNTGDGVITYSSSNPTVASVDTNTGMVHINDIGETIIYATASETENYKAKTISYRLIVKKKEIYPTLLVDDQVFTGSEIKPDVTVKMSENILVNGVDYELIYEDNTNVGTAKVTAKSLETSKYTFERMATFYINRKEITEEFVITPLMIAYDEGNTLTPKVTVKDNNRVLVKDTDYTVSYSNQTAGINSHVNVYVYGAGNYKGTVAKEVLIENPTLIELETPVLKISKGASNSLVLTSNNNKVAVTYEIYRSTSSKKGFTKIAEVEDNSYINANLTYGTTYYYKVIAKYNDAKTGYSNLVSMRVVPDKLDDLNILSVSTNQVKLGWTKFDNVTGYEIARSNKINGRYTTIATLKNVDNYTNSKLSGNTTYFYKVRAYKLVGRTKVYGSYSSILEVKTSPVAPKLVLSVSDYDAINVNISSVKGATRYELYRSLNKTDYVKIASLNAFGNYKDGLLTTGVTYYYKVRACNNTCGSYSSVVSKVPVPKTPSITTSVSETKKIKVSMTEINGADGYEIYRSTNKYRNFKLVKNVDSNVYDDEVGLNTTYYYKVRAYRVVEGKKIYSGYSSVKSARVTLSAPSFNVNKTDINTVNFTINSVKGAVGYEIYRSTNKYRNYKSVGSTNTLEYSEIINLNTTYYYKVRSFILVNGKKAYSGYSSYKSVKASIGIPTYNLTKENVNELTFTINPVTGADGYEVWKSTNSRRGFYYIGSTDINEFETIVSLNTTYYYKVRGYRLVNGKKNYGGYSSVKSTKATLGVPTITVTRTALNGVKLTLSEVNHADGYEIYRSTNQYKGFTLVGTELELNQELNLNTNYYYKVRAYKLVNDKKNYGSYSSLKVVKLNLGTPTFSLDGQEQQVEVRIDELDYALGYEIWRSTSSKGTFTKVGETLELTYNDPCQANKTYYYKLRAYTTFNEKKIYSGYTSIKNVKSK